ncbi:MAG: precorrin-3B C(17)-methyltransferase [Pseudomonadota bacterium]
MSAGTLTIVGVGPGDPELMTRKAARCLAAAQVVAYPVSRGGSMAARIAGADIAHAQHLPFDVPMTGDGAAETAYDGAAEAIAARLCEGCDVALLCEGDPTLYGSAASIAERLADEFDVAIIPGVIAASAGAAALGRSLVRGEESLTIVPATAPPQRLTAALRSGAALAVYKVGRHFDRVARAVRREGRDGTLVQRVSLPDAATQPLQDAPPGPKPYFSMVLVAPKKRQAEPPAVGDSSGSVAVLALSQEGLALASRIVIALRASRQDARTHGLVTRTGDADVSFADPLSHMGALFEGGVPIVAVASSGIVIRALAPHLCDKREEPPVVAVAQDGSAVVPLLGAHRGGTRLAEAVGNALGVRPAVTTRSDTELGVPLDDPPEGFVVADRGPFKALAANPFPEGGSGLADPRLTFLPKAYGWACDVAATVSPAEDAAHVPTYVMRSVVVGMGAERGADPSAAVALLHKTLEEAGIDARAVACVASLDVKADETALHAAAQSLGVPLRVFGKDALAEQEARLERPSQVVLQAVGVSGVAEGAALAACGEGGTLLVPKTAHDRLTIAVASALAPLVPLPGRARGHVAVVGIGPGAGAWRTGELLRILARADCFVGYGLYLDLVEDLRGDRPRHDFPLGAEEERTRFALETAGEGRTVALISSGDAGIYAMASLAAELLERGGLSDAAQRIELSVAPGISAAQAAAARVGAPLGHDFAFISLSDLLTPWEAIERRLEAAAKADFVTALYNPRSQRRTTQLEAAADIFRHARPAQTPVIVASRIGRADEAIAHETLATFRPEAVDMLSTVLIGASSTRRFVRGDGKPIVYTPRGYGGRA